MHADLALRRRVLIITYRRYIEAERAWTVAMSDMRSWFPPGSRPYRAAIGEPGSRMRRLYERRERAVQHLAAARLKLATAKRRLEARRAQSTGRRLLLISCRAG